MFISIPEAIHITGKSQATIYRLLKKPESKPHVRYDKGVAAIDKNYLLSVYSVSHDSNEKRRESRNFYENHSVTDDDVAGSWVKALIDTYPAELLIEREKQIQYLKSEIERKNQQLHQKEIQLEQKDRLLADIAATYSERLREAHINLQTLQQSYHHLVKELPGSKAASQETVNATADYTQGTLDRSTVFAILAITILTGILFGGTVVLWQYFVQH